MMRLRNLLVAAPIAGILAVCGLATGTQSADAFVTGTDYCSGYLGGFIYWGHEIENELIRSDFQETPYFEYAYAQQLAYSRLLDTHHCP